MKEGACGAVLILGTDMDGAAAPPARKGRPKGGAPYYLVAGGMEVKWSALVRNHSTEKSTNERVFAEM